MAADQNTLARVLALIPQQRPFRFIDDIEEADDRHIRASYRFRKDELFYPGHFPGHPVTPGVILIETMAQTGVVAMGIHLLLQQGLTDLELQHITPLFAFADDIEFSGIVHPEEPVIIFGDLIYFRKGTIKTRARMERQNGEIVCRGVLTGAGVNKSSGVN